MNEPHVSLSKLLSRRDVVRLLAGTAVVAPLTVAGLKNDVFASGSGTAVRRSISTNMMSVAALSLSFSGSASSPTLTATAQVVSGGAGVAGARVTLDFAPPSGRSVRSSSYTNSNGVVTISRTFSESGTYTVRVVSVSKRGYRYDASQSVSMASTLVADEPMPSVTPTSAPPSDAVNVRDFGAAGDGSTDDTQAINSALSAAAGKTLYFPAGAYRVTSTLYLRGPLRLRGDGAAASVVSWPGNMILFDVLNTADVTIEQLGVTGNYPDSSWGYAVVAGDTSRLKIDGCAFKNTPETAVSLWGVDDVSVTSTRFENIAASGVRLENAQLNENVVVRDCVFVGVNAAQISGHAAVQCHGSVEALHRNVWIERNHIESRGVGLGLDSINYGTIANNRIIGPNDWAVEGIAFSGSNNTLLGNEINNARAAGILLWAVASQPNDNNLIDANHCYDNQLGIGIACDKGTPSVTNLTITRNTCFDTDSGSQDQSYGVQWYVDTNYGGATFTWSNIQVTYNDLSGNLVGPWIFDGGVEPYFEGNKV